MSRYPNPGCGLPSKPRYAQPSMFQLLSWAGQKQLSQLRFQQAQRKISNPSCYCLQEKAQNQIVKNCCCVNNYSNPLQLPKDTQVVIEQVYRQHNLPQKTQNIPTNTICQVLQVKNQNESNTFKKSRLHPKEIKHDLYSYEPVNLKASRAKSALVSQKVQVSGQKPKRNQQFVLDDKTIEERKQRLKEFQNFTRILPNSAFTTYYGKPAFQNYGRGTSTKNLKSYNVMPHKGENHPKNIESHYTALIKARNVKSKSHLPRKPVEQEICPPKVTKVMEQNVQVESVHLPLEKPDLIKSSRFATVIPNNTRKAGPPPLYKKTMYAQTLKSTKKVPKSQTKHKKSKTFKQPASDGLKFMNKRENLIDLLQEKKLKASQLAYKVTECYPLQLQNLELKESTVSKQNWEHSKPAGKQTTRCDKVQDIIQSRFILQETNARVK